MGSAIFRKLKHGSENRRSDVIMTKSLAEKIAELDAKRAEVAALEKEVATGIVGSLVCVTGEGYHGDIKIGTIVKVLEIDHDYEEYPYKCELLDGSDFDRLNIAELEFLTPEAARARLIADIDRQLAEACGQ